jgi:tetratricopeptide (TPR) repeat protein
MKRLLALICALMSVAVAFAQLPTSAPANALSPAQRSIAQAQKLIDKKPTNFEAYNALALALSRRARETSDVSYYAHAEEALNRSFAIAPGNYDGEKIRVWLLLGKHEFAAALDAATRLNRKVPDDVMVYGFLTDANVELGNYEDAEKAAQWMLDLRAGTVPGLTRAAYLRELFGDIDGALELMEMAYGSTPPSELEDRAWILTQMAHLNLATGRTEESEMYSEQALTLFPGYHYALGNLAKVRLAQHRYDEAIRLLRQRYEAAPHAENLFEIAEALKMAGRNDEAQTAFAEFERKSLLESSRADNSNHELVFYYTDRAGDPARALEIAKSEIARRHDLHTLDAYAWALYKNGEVGDARKQIEAALGVGVREAKLFYHAGEIALRAGDRNAAERYFHQAVDLNTLGSEQAHVALQQLSRAAR